MPKVKTRKSVLKRIKITASGKLLRGHQYKGHLRANKTKRRIRRFHEPIVLNKTQTKAIKQLLAL